MYKIEDRYCGICSIKLDKNKSENTNNIMDGIKECLAGMGLRFINKAVSEDHGDLTFSYKERGLIITIYVSYHMDSVGHNMITVKACYGKVPENKKNDILKIINFLNSTFFQTQISMLSDTGDIELRSGIFLYKFFNTVELCLSVEYLLNYGRMYLDAISTNETAETLIDRLKNGE